MTMLIFFMHFIKGYNTLGILYKNIVNKEILNIYAFSGLIDICES